MPAHYDYEKYKLGSIKTVIIKSTNRNLMNILEGMSTCLSTSCSHACSHACSNACPHDYKKYKLRSSRGVLILNHTKKKIKINKNELH